MKRPSTKEVIADAALLLLQTYDIAELTVVQIAQEAEISVRTFYNHFFDKFDVCNYIYDFILEKHCWIVDGQRNNLSKFFIHVCDMIDKDYAKFFEHTMNYHGQNSIHEHIVSRGVKDLVRCLEWTGHSDMVTPELLRQLEFYMCGLDGTLTLSMNKKQKKDTFLNISDKLDFLPMNLAQYLNEDPNSSFDE